ncbi:MAG: ATP-binding protein [Tannerellaceae bacterium]|nr:ATP-binding protein [Tannerellaceae bacterium]
MAETLHIKNEITQLTLLNDYIRRAVDTLGLSATAGMSLILAVEEAVVNIILYAYPGETDKDIFVTLKYDEEAVTVVVTDYGVAFNPAASEDPDMSTSAEERPIGGLGVFLMKKLMNDVSYHRIGDMNVLTMIQQRYA